MVPFEAPAPGAGGGGLAENGGEVGLGVAELGAFLDLSKEGLESNDGIDLGEARVAEGGLEELADESGLFFGEGFEWDAVAFGGDVVPVLSLLWGEGETGFLCLSFIQ